MGLVLAADKPQPSKPEQSPSAIHLVVEGVHSPRSSGSSDYDTVLLQSVLGCLHVCMCSVFLAF